MLIPNIQKTIILLGITAFFTVGALGMGNFGMTADANGQMSNCPFMGVTAVCKMSPLGHIDAWQNMFTALPFKSALTLFTLLLLAIFAALLFRDLLDNQRPRLVYARRFRNPTHIVRNELQEAFSNGILHPKIF